MVTQAFNKQNIAMLFNLKIEDGKAVAQKKDITLTGLQKLAQDALNGSIGTTLLLLGALVLAVMAVVGVLYLLFG
jgi:hypothetical protein